MTVDGAGPWVLFLSALLSSTLLPGGSEMALVMLATYDERDSWVLWVVASAGNTLGGMSTWGVGRFVDWWYPASRFTCPRYQRAVRWLQHWGSPALLLSWVPVVGDPLCVAGGWLRVSWAWALFWIGLGKASRYAVILFVAA